MSASISAAPMLVGGSEVVQATVSYSDGQTRPAPALTWTTSNASVIQVSSSGAVTAVGEGRAQVIATASGVQGSLTVDVERVGTQVQSGVLNTDTTWTRAASPYRLMGTTQVARGVKLTIEAGAIVTGPSNLTPGALVVGGGLEAIGTQAQPITFRGVRVTPAGSQAQPHLINLERVMFSGGSLYAPTGNAIYGSLRLVDSRLAPGEYAYIWYPTSPVLIERNVIDGGWRLSIGFRQSGAEPFVVVRNNYFVNASIENWAAYDSATGPIVEFNTFGGSGIALTLPAGYDSSVMTATNNWWGTTDPAVIATRIYDRNDDITSGGVVPFQPFLTAPHPNTPVP
jgi:hypothetical protein